MFYLKNGGARAELRWPSLGEYLARNGYRHPKAGREWRPRSNEPAYVARLLDLCMDLTESPIPARFQNTKLADERYRRLGERVLLLFDMLEHIAAAPNPEQLPPGIRVEWSAWAEQCLLAFEPFVTRILTNLELTKIEQRLVKERKLSSARRLLELLEETGRSPFAPELINNSDVYGNPSRWPDKGTLSHALYATMGDRNAAVHAAPDAALSQLLTVGWSCACLLLAITEHSFVDLAKAFPPRKRTPRSALQGVERSVYTADLLPPRHVRGLRAAALTSGLDAICRDGALVIWGAPGVGKSAVAAEVICGLVECGLLSRGIGVIEANIRRAHTMLDTCAQLDSTQNLRAGAAVVAAMAERSAVLWIRSYDRASYRAILELWREVRRLNTRTDGLHRAVWLVESLVPFEAEGTQLEVGPMEAPDLCQILEATPAGRVAHDANDIVALAQGNPAEAIWRWQGTDAMSARQHTDSHFEWLESQLSPTELAILPAVCYVLTESPLGATIEVVSAWVQRVHSGRLTRDLQSALDILLGRLEAWQLLAVDRADGRSFGGLLSKILEPQAAFAYVRDLNGSLADYVLGRVTADESSSWEATLQEILLEEADDDANLTAVTLLLLAGDLEPFFRSSFRFTYRHLPAVVRWLDSAPRCRRAASRTQLYIERGLRLLHQEQLAKSYTLDVDSELGKPDPASQVQGDVYDALRARAACYRGTDGRLDVAAQEAFCSRLPRARATWLEAHVYLAQSYGQAGDHANAWQLMESLLEEQALGAQRALVLYHGLAFLNKFKYPPEILPAERADPLRERLGAELIRAAVQSGNVTSLYNAIFFLVRAREHRAARADPSSVEQYASALRAVERVGGRRRIQAILTQGAIHRHRCRAEQLQPRQRIEAVARALREYARAYGSSVARGHDNFQLEASAAMLDCCVKSLHAAGEQAFGVFVADYFPPALERAYETMESLPHDAVRHGEKRTNLCLDYAVVLLAAQIGTPGLDGEQLAVALERATNILWASTEGRATWERRKQTTKFHRRLVAAAALARTRPERWRELQTQIAPVVRSHVDRVRTLLPRRRRGGREPEGVRRFRRALERFEALLL